tara:strand:- start:196 stop:441 length:246 start_codon:yes stop_codon:yes gene_type:complete
MVKIILIFFLLTSPVLADCKYYAEADVVNDVLVNKKEHYTCTEEEKDNFLVTFFTDPKYSVAAEQVYTMLYIATIKALGFN